MTNLITDYTLNCINTRTIYNSDKTIKSHVYCQNIIDSYVYECKPCTEYFSQHPELNKFKNYNILDLKIIEKKIDNIEKYITDINLTSTIISKICLSDDLFNLTIKNINNNLITNSNNITNIFKNIINNKTYNYILHFINTLPHINTQIIIDTRIIKYIVKLNTNIFIQVITYLQTNNIINIIPCHDNCILDHLLLNKYINDNKYYYLKPIINNILNTRIYYNCNNENDKCMTNLNNVIFGIGLNYNFKNLKYIYDIYPNSITSTYSLKQLIHSKIICYLRLKQLYDYFSIIKFLLQKPNTFVFDINTFILPTFIRRVHYYLFKDYPQSYLQYLSFIIKLLLKYTLVFNHGYAHLCNQKNPIILDIYKPYIHDINANTISKYDHQVETVFYSLSSLFSNYDLKINIVTKLYKKTLSI